MRKCGVCAVVTCVLVQFIVLEPGSRMVTLIIADGDDDCLVHAWLKLRNLTFYYVD